MSAGSGAGIINVDRSESLRKESGLYAPAEVVRFLRVLQKTREYLQANVDAQLALEVLALDLPNPSLDRLRMTAGSG